jgi:DNA-directed RNA polymerase specialized sigma24 family protein
MDRLDGRAATVVKGHYFEGLKLGELAEKMGMTPVAMRQLLHRVRVLLLECVRRRLSSAELSS